MKNLNYYENEDKFELGGKYNIQNIRFPKEMLNFVLSKIKIKA